MGRPQSEETRRKISEALKGKTKPATSGSFISGYSDKRHRFTSEFARSISVKANAAKREKQAKASFNDACKAEKFRRVLSEQEGKCFECAINTWADKPITLQIHHIDGNNQNNARENLVYLCPNFHTQTDNYGFKKRI